MKTDLEAYPVENSLTVEQAAEECACCKNVGMLDIIQRLFEMDLSR